MKSYENFRRPKTLRQAVTIDDIRELARNRLPKMVFDFVDGGAEDERTLQDNRSAFSHMKFMPRVLVDVAKRNQSVKVCDTDLSLPVGFAPTGLPGIVHPQAELAAVAVANRVGTVFTLSSASTHSIEKVAEVSNGPLWFQLYPWRDRKVTGQLIERAKSAGYRALCVTVDVPVNGGRERDIYNGMTLPPRIDLHNAINVLSKPRWCLQQLIAPRITLTNLIGVEGAPGKSVSTLGAWAQQLLYPSCNWEDFDWIRKQWHGPLLVKGIINKEDARLAVKHGADGIVVSNHGGRQLDSVPSTLEVLPQIADAVGEQADILIDSGIRRGSDVLKAMALGAKACLVGRPYLYGLGAGGEQGIEKVFDILKVEIDRALALLGRSDIQNVDRHNILNTFNHAFNDERGVGAHVQQPDLYVGT